MDAATAVSAIIISLFFSSSLPLTDRARARSTIPSCGRRRHRGRWWQARGSALWLFFTEIRMFMATSLFVPPHGHAYNNVGTPKFPPASTNDRPSPYRTRPYFYVFLSCYCLLFRRFRDGDGQGQDPPRPLVCCCGIDPKSSSDRDGPGRTEFQGFRDGPIFFGPVGCTVPTSSRGTRRIPQRDT